LFLFVQFDLASNLTIQFSANGRTKKPDSNELGFFVCHPPPPRVQTLTLGFHPYLPKPISDLPHFGLELLDFGSRLPKRNSRSQEIVFRSSHFGFRSSETSSRPSQLPRHLYWTSSDAYRTKLGSPQLSSDKNETSFHAYRFSSDKERNKKGSHLFPRAAYLFRKGSLIFGGSLSLSSKRRKKPNSVESGFFVLKIAACASVIFRRKPFYQRRLEMPSTRNEGAK